MPLNIAETFPFNHEQAVSALMHGAWTAKEQAVIAQGGVPALHHGFGTTIRSCWGLSDRTYPLTKYYRQKYGLGNADDMSHLILQDFVSRMRGDVKFCIEHEVSWLKKHWLDRGVDPLTMERTV